MTKTKEEKDYTFCMETLDRLNSLQDNYMERAKDLYEIKQLSLYRPSWDSFEEYCMEIKSLKYPSVMKLIAIHEKFVLEYKISPARITKAGGWSNVAEILPVVENKDDAEKWLNKAEEMPREHLRQDVKENKTGIDQSTCNHKGAYLIRVCTDCGMKERIYEK